MDVLVSSKEYLCSAVREVALPPYGVGNFLLNPRLHTGHLSTASEPRCAEVRGAALRRWDEPRASAVGLPLTAVAGIFKPVNPSLVGPLLGNRVCRCAAQADRRGIELAKLNRVYAGVSNHASSAGWRI